jgi:hypothetical protein
LRVLTGLRERRDKPKFLEPRKPGGRLPKLIVPHAFCPVFMKRFWRAKGFFFVGLRINGIEIQMSKARVNIDRTESELGAQRPARNSAEKLSLNDAVGYQSSCAFGWSLRSQF